MDSAFKNASKSSAAFSLENFSHPFIIQFVIFRKKCYLEKVSMSQLATMSQLVTKIFIRRDN